MNGGGARGEGRPASRVPLWSLADERCELRAEEMEYVRRLHRHEPGGHQCTSVVAKHVRAPVHIVSNQAYVLVVSSFIVLACKHIWFISILNHLIACLFISIGFYSSFFGCLWLGLLSSGVLKPFCVV